MVIFVNANVITLKNLFISDEIHSNRKEYKVRQNQLFLNQECTLTEAD